MSISIGILPYKILSLHCETIVLKKVFNKKLYNIKSTKNIFFTPCVNSFTSVKSRICSLSSVWQMWSARLCCLYDSSPVLLGLGLGLVISGPGFQVELETRFAAQAQKP